MIDQRRLQRTLFRMQADRGFARAILSGEDEAVASTELGERELGLLQRLDPRGIEADPRGERSTQVLGNAASEYTLTLAAASARKLATDFLSAFASSPEFHQTMAANGRLPLAFGEYAGRRLVELEASDLIPLLELEAAMVRARRELQRVTEPTLPAPGTVVLSPFVRLHEAPAGVVALAGEIRIATERNQPLPGTLDTRWEATEHETVALLSRAIGSPHRLPELYVEAFRSPASKLLVAALEPLDDGARRELAGRFGATREGLNEFIGELVGDGFLVSAPSRDCD